MAEALHIVEVGPRDGLQNQPALIPAAGKIELIHALAHAGLREIEATAFVSPKAVPQMADAPSVMAGLAELRGAALAALVPNAKGLALAVASGLKEVSVVLAATETMNRKNINRSLADAETECGEVLRTAKKQGLRTRAYLAVAFGCPFEGTVPQQRVLELAGKLASAGADELVFADTIGAGAPIMAQRLFRAAVEGFGASRVAAHLHDTRGLALANCWAAMEAGVRKFDTSVGGLGGCPFAPGAAGNLATEDLVLMAQQCGFETGVDMERLYQALVVAERLTGRSLGGRSAAWWRGAKGPRSAMQERTCALAG